MPRRSLIEGGDGDGGLEALLGRWGVRDDELMADDVDVDVDMAHDDGDGGGGGDKLAG